MPINQYKIVPTWNNAGNLVNAESIAVSGASKYLNDMVKGLAFDAQTSYFVSSSPISENLVYLADGSSIGQGYTRIEWLFKLMSDDALEYWRSTYVGKMTIATKSGDVFDEYTNWNAILDKPFVTREQRRHAQGVWWYMDVVVGIKLVGAPS